MSSGRPPRTSARATHIRAIPTAMTPAPRLPPPPEPAAVTGAVPTPPGALPPLEALTAARRCAAAVRGS
ncbi:hypothetical protein QFZ55_001263 [Streptomyces luteogriseus]|nr:hypothetical protein [Streptomyces luteogriseus]